MHLQDFFVIFPAAAAHLACSPGQRPGFPLNLPGMPTVLRFITRICFLLIFFGHGPRLAGQTIPAFETISVAQGLSQGMVFDLLQDREGFIWVATKNGLNRYDGYSFTVYTNDPYDPHSLSSNIVTTLFEDSQGRIWAGTENAGVNVFDKRTGKFYRISNRPNDPASLSGNRVYNCISEMQDGRILVPAEDAGFNVISLSPEFFERDAAPKIRRKTLPGNAQVYGIGRDENGTTWISDLQNRVYRYDPDNEQMNPLPGSRFVNNAYGLGNGEIWTTAQFFLWDGVRLRPLFDTKKYKPGNLVLNPTREPWLNFHEEPEFYQFSLYLPGQPPRWGQSAMVTTQTRVLYPFLIDKSGIFWAGTKGYGLRKYNLSRSRFRLQAPGVSIRYIVPAGKDIYLGSYPYEWRKLTPDSQIANVFQHYFTGTEVDNVLIDKRGEYWIRTDNRGLFRFNIKTLQVTPLPDVDFGSGQRDKQPMIEDRQGFIWFPALGGKITRIDRDRQVGYPFTINTNPQKPMLNKAITTAMYEDRRGIVWIGTEQGFCKVTPKTDPAKAPEVTWYYNDPDNRNSLNYSHVSCFLEDPVAPDKYLWICTKGGGLNRLDRSTGDFIHVTTRDGLPNDVVYGILTDGEGNIWGSTNKGIFCLLRGREEKGWTFRNFTRADGLQDDEFNTGAFAQLPDGRLAFGGVNGINIFDPREMLTPGFTPNLYITNILVNNQPTVPGDKSGVLKSTIEQTRSITLNHQQDILTLEFASLDFTQPSLNKYRYKLEGADEDWIESGSRRSATYLHLPPGNYTFRVQGSNSQGIWSSRMAELQIRVLPAWWRSWWAYAIYAFVALLALIAYFRFSVNRARLRSQLQLEQHEARRAKELDTLKTQLYTNITHEFRTPLTVILGMAHQVAAKPEEHLKTGTDMIIRNGENLLRLVNELLDLSKLESGKMGLQQVQGDLILFLRYVVESFQSLADSQHKQLHFLSEIDSLPVTYDPEKLRQIMANLLSNALKFTPEKGNIYLSVARAITPGAPGRENIIVKVKDTGIGIPEDQLPYIFDRFFQASNRHSQTSGGTGIGLALARELARLMDGDISVKSPPTGANRGTEFSVTLSLPAAAAESIPAPETEAGSLAAPANPVTKTEKLFGQNGNGDRPLILLVEDNADVVAYTASCLPDYRLAVGKDGMEGLEIANDMTPDLIITDVMMPVIDGFELCSRLRQNPGTSHIPIIMLTAKANLESRMEGLERGADVYLEKPFNRQELVLRIRKLLEMRKSLQQYYLSRAGLTQQTAEATAAPAVATEDRFVTTVREAIEKHMEDVNFSVEQLCKYVFMSHSQLHRKLEALTGCSPNRFIRLVRLNRARQLLQDPARSIASIALDCGYNDPAYFSRVFKQETGMTPQEWRSQPVQT